MLPTINIAIEMAYVQGHFLILNMLFIEPMDVQTYELSDRNA